MRFREVREVSEEEKLRKQKEDEANQNYKKIKPKTDITVEDCKKFLDDLFGG